MVESIVDKRPALTVRRKNLERFVAAEVVRQPSTSLIGLTVYGRVTSNLTWGAAMPPSLATRLQVPSAADLTIVGNSSVVYKKIMLNDAAIPKRPMSATTI